MMTDDVVDFVVKGCSFNMVRYQDQATPGEIATASANLVVKDKKTYKRVKHARDLETISALVVDGVAMMAMQLDDLSVS
jgi:hypothetical protein